MNNRLVTLIPATFALYGCVALPIPHDRLVTPVIQGTVIDAKTNAPIPNARVQASAYSHKGDQIPSKETMTDQLGRFEISAVERKNWMVAVLLAPFEGFCTGSFTVNKDGYKPLTFEEEYFGPANFNGVCSSHPIKRNVQLEPIQ